MSVFLAMFGVLKRVRRFALFADGAVTGFKCHSSGCAGLPFA